MAGFSEGVQSGLALRRSWDDRKSREHEDEWRDKVRGRKEREWSDEDSIREAGQMALRKMGGQAEPARAAEPAQGAQSSPVAPRSQSELTRLPQAGDEMLPNEVEYQQTSMGQPEAMLTNTDNPAGKADQPPPMALSRPGLAQGGVPGAEQPMSDAAAQPMSIGDPAQQAGGAHQQPAQGAPPDALRQQPAPMSPGQMDQINSQYMAQAKRAMELGRTDLALQYHMNGMKLREQLRGKAFDSAEAKYRSTQDPNVYVDAFNRYVANGVDVDRIEKSGTGFIVSGRTDKGEAFNQPMSPEQFSGYVNFLKDPKVARALEAERANTLYKEAAEMRKVSHKGGEDRKTKAAELTQKAKTDAALESVKSTFALRKVGAEGKEERRTGAAKGYQDRKTQTVKDRFQSVSKDAALVDTWDKSWTKNQGSGSSPIPDHVQKTAKETNSLILKQYGASDLSGLEPNIRAQVTKDMETASDLLSASYGTKAAGDLTAAKAAAITRAVNTGGAKRVILRNEKSGQTAEFIEYNGKKYPLSRPRS